MVFEEEPFDPSEGIPPPEPEPEALSSPGPPFDASAPLPLILQEDQRSFLGVVKQTADTGVADTEYAVTHNLGYIPDHWFPASVDKGGVIYKSATTWTENTAYFKCTVANVNAWVILG